MSSVDDSKQVVAARQIYMEHLMSLLTPVMMQKMLNLFNEVKNSKSEGSNRTVLRRFQDLLREIPDWNQHIVDAEVTKLSCQTDPGLLEDLITTIMVSNAEILSVVNVSSTRNKINLKIPKISVFIHNCFIELARKLYKNIFLFSDKNSSADKQRDMHELESLTQESIRLAIQKALPIHDIIKQYVTSGGGDPELTKENLKNLQDPDVAHALLNGSHVIGRENQADDTLKRDDEEVRSEKDVRLPEKDHMHLESLTLEESDRPSKTDDVAESTSNSIPEDDYIAPEDDLRPAYEDDAHVWTIDDIFLPDHTNVQEAESGPQISTDISKNDELTSDQEQRSGVNQYSSNFDMHERQSAKNDDKDGLESLSHAEESDETIGENELDRTDNMHDDGSRSDNDHKDAEDVRSKENENDHSTKKISNENTGESRDKEMTAVEQQSVKANNSSQADDDLEIHFDNEDDQDYNEDNDPIQLTLGGNTSEDSEAEEPSVRPQNEKNKIEISKEIIEPHHMTKSSVTIVPDDKSSDQRFDHDAENLDEDIDNIIEDELYKEDEDAEGKSQDNHDVTAVTHITSFPSDDDDHIHESDLSDEENLPAPCEESDFADSEMDDYNFTDDDLYSDQEEVDHMLSSLNPKKSQIIHEQQITSSNTEDVKPKSTSKLEAFIGELAPKKFLKDRTDDDVVFSPRKKAGRKKVSIKKNPVKKKVSSKAIMIKSEPSSESSEEEPDRMNLFENTSVKRIPSGVIEDDSGEEDNSSNIGKRKHKNKVLSAKETEKSTNLKKKATDKKTIDSDQPKNSIHEPSTLSNNSSDIRNIVPRVTSKSDEKQRISLFDDAASDSDD